MTGTRSWGIRLICLVLCLGCLLGALPMAAATAEELPEEPDTIAASFVYASATARSRIIGRMEDGTEVTVLGENGGYYKIDCYDLNGYIAISQVQKKENGKYYVCCEAESSHTAKTEIRTMADALLLRAAVLELAKQQLGDPYVYGATGPNAFDCSGFTSFVFKNNGYSMARLCSGQMAQGIIVSKDGLQVGDLIFFGPSVNGVNHVGIYAGDGQVIHAGGKGICYAELDGVWCSGNYLCARRIITVGDQITQINPTVAADNLMTRRVDTAIRSVG